MVFPLINDSDITSWKEPSMFKHELPRSSNPNLVTPVDLGTTRQSVNERDEDSAACHTSFDLHFLEFLPFIALTFAENSLFIEEEGLLNWRR